MSIITVTASQFADLMRVFDMVLLPVSVQGFVYGVKKGSNDENIYRVAVA